MNRARAFCGQKARNESVSLILNPCPFLQASTLISSLESVLSGGDALMNEKSTSEEAIKRIQKAQALIGKFIAESGVQDEKLAAYVSAHK